MTEQEWLACTDPQPMLALLRESEGVSERKLRLLACACVRQSWHWLGNGPASAATETAERFADGAATYAEMTATREAARLDGWEAVRVAALKTTGGVNELWQVPNLAVAGAAGWVRFDRRDEIRKSTRETQCHLIRDIFGNPFRPIVIVPSILNWNDGCILKLAQTIYDQGSFDRLPILADALEEAGCIDADILNHCRQPGEHVRGCWVIDALLGKS